MATETISGGFDKVIGKIKQKTGEAFGDQELANEGVADQIKGNAKEAYGHVKDAAHDATTRHETHAERTGNDLRDSVVAGAEHVKESIRRGVDHISHSDIETEDRRAL